MFQPAGGRLVGGFHQVGTAMGAGLSSRLIATSKKPVPDYAADIIAIAKRGTCKIHLRLVAQAFQPVQMRVAGRCNIKDPQFSNMLFMKEYQDDILQI